MDSTTGWLDRRSSDRVTHNNGLHRTAASSSEGESVIARIVNKVPADVAQWAGGEPGR